MLGETFEVRRGGSGLTAGCCTSNSERMVAPSLVIVTSPMLSTNILSSLFPKPRR